MNMQSYLETTIILATLVELLNRDDGMGTQAWCDDVNEACTEAFTFLGYNKPEEAKK